MCKMPLFDKWDEATTAEMLKERDEFNGTLLHIAAANKKLHKIAKKFLTLEELN